MGSRTARQDLEPTGAGIEARRAQILEAATRLFAERGYHATTIDEVAEAASVAKGTVYWYFRSKKALFLEVLRSVSAAFRESLSSVTAEVESPLARLERSVEATIALARSRPDLARLYFLEIVDADEGFVRARAKISAQLQRDLHGTLGDSVDAGEIPPADLDLLTGMITGAVEAAARYALDGPQETSLGPVVAAFVRRGAGAGEHVRTTPKRASRKGAG